MIALRAAIAAAISLLSFGALAAPPVTEIHIAGGASFQEGKIALVGYSAIIEQQGWLSEELKKKGIKLSWFPVSHAATGPMINEAFASKAIEFAGYGDLPSLILNASGVETRLIVPNGLSGAGDTYLVVPANSPAKSIEDLKGKRLAVHKGRPWEIPLLRLLDSKGLTYADFQTYNIDPNAGAIALTTGNVDGLYTIANDAFLLEEKHVGRILWSTAEVADDWKMRTELWGAKWFLDEHPDIAQLVVTAYVKAAAWAANPVNRDAALKLVVRPGTPEVVIKRTYAGDDSQWRSRWSPVFLPSLTDHYRITESYAFDKKLVGAHVDIGHLIEPKFVNAALADQHLTQFWPTLSAR